MSENDIARALFHFSASVQSRVMATDWPNGWEWHMHPGTWVRIRRDTAMAQYITPAATKALSGPDDLIGCPVQIDPAMPLGAVEIRYSDQMMLPLA